MADAEAPEGVAIRYCANHPRVETVVSCGRCDKPICPQCMIFTPGGIRCRDCAQLRRLPQYTLSPQLYAKVIASAVALALVVGYLLSLVSSMSLLGGLLAGFAIGEGLRRASGYKQGREMQILAGLAVVLSMISTNVFLVLRVVGIAHIGEALTYAFAPQSLTGSALGIIIGVFVAVQRLR